MEPVLYCRALPAKEVAAQLQALVSEALSKVPCRVQVKTAVPEIRFDLNASSQNDEQVRSNVEFERAVNALPALMARSALVTDLRHHSGIIEYSCDDEVVGKFGVHAHGSVELATELIRQVQRRFKAQPYLDVVGATASKAESAALKIRERAAADLQDAVKQLAEFQSQLAVREAKRREKLDADQAAAYQARLDKLDAEYRERQADLDRKRDADLEAIAAKTRKLEDDRAQFETREARHMRRELLKQIREVLKEAEATTLSEPTGNKRWWVHVGAWILAAASATAAGVMVVKLYDAPALDWHLLAPFSASFVTFALTMVYYLKWNDRWFREHADAELAAKRYKADILRASWIAELVQEWAKEGKGDLPPELIAAYTRGLFTDVGPSRVSEHPLDNLTDLIKRATGVRISKGALEVRAPAMKRKGDVA